MKPPPSGRTLGAPAGRRREMRRLASERAREVAGIDDARGRAARRSRSRGQPPPEDRLLRARGPHSLFMKPRPTAVDPSRLCRSGVILVPVPVPVPVPERVWTGCLGSEVSVTRGENLRRGRSGTGTGTGTGTIENSFSNARPPLGGFLKPRPTGVDPYMCAQAFVNWSTQEPRRQPGAPSGARSGVESPRPGSQAV